jgi:hypothetical protein
LSLRLLGPVVGLNIWHFVMEYWMYSERLPAIAKYMDGVVSNTTPKERAFDKLPPSVRWKAENYNHLFEQPTQFYAVALTMALLAHRAETAGAAGATGLGELDVRLAWAYVGIRVVHSLVQSLGNRIPVRFGLFASCSIALTVLTGRAGFELWRLSK